jgi:hypothetical protein
MRELPSRTPMASGETSAIVASPQTGVRRIVGLKIPRMHNPCRFKSGLGHHLLRKKARLQRFSLTFFIAFVSFKKIEDLIVLVEKIVDYYFHNLFPLLALFITHKFLK